MHGDAQTQRSQGATNRLCMEASLPKFFFQVAGGNHVLDVDGRELPSASTARIEGIKFAGEILKDMPTLLYETASVKIDVTDENGQVLFKVLVTTLGDDDRNSNS